MHMRGPAPHAQSERRWPRGPRGSPGRSGTPSCRASSGPRVVGCADRGEATRRMRSSARSPSLHEVAARRPSKAAPTRSHHRASFSQSDGESAAPAVMTSGAARTGAGRSGTCTTAALSRTLPFLRSNACLMSVSSAPCWASASFPFFGHEYPRLPSRSSKRRVRRKVGGKDR